MTKVLSIISLLWRRLWALGIHRWIRFLWVLWTLSSIWTWCGHFSRSTMCEIPLQPALATAAVTSLGVARSSMRQVHLLKVSSVGVPILLSCLSSLSACLSHIPTPRLLCARFFTLLFPFPQYTSCTNSVALGVYTLEGPEGTHFASFYPFTMAS